jgi:drug/metabolite transporter (DMT)-like permease
MQRSSTVAAAVWMTGAIVSFTSMAVAGRAVSSDLDTFEIMLFRSVVGVCIVVTITLLTGQRGKIRPARLGLHGMRNLLHFTGQNLWFFAITLIPLAQVFSIEFSAPLWVTLLAPLFLGERITLTRAGAALLGFAGILIVARPDFGHVEASSPPRLPRSVSRAPPSARNA